MRFKILTFSKCVNNASIKNSYVTVLRLKRNTFDKKDLNKIKMDLYEKDNFHNGCNAVYWR